MKNYKILLFQGQVVAVKRYHPALPAVPENRSQRRKTDLRAAA